MGRACCLLARAAAALDDISNLIIDYEIELTNNRAVFRHRTSHALLAFATQVNTTASHDPRQRPSLSAVR